MIPEAHVDIFVESNSLFASTAPTVYGDMIIYIFKNFYSVVLHLHL